MAEEKILRETFKGIRLTQEETAIIEAVQKEQNLSDFSKTFCYILRDYSRKQNELQNLQQENENLKEENQKQMTRIRLASNGADVNVQVLLEVLNTLCWKLQTNDFRSTDQMMHPVVEEAQKTVKDRIARFKQAKDSKQK